MAWPYQAAFSYEPVGPRAFPLLMLGLMGLALLYMVFRPHRSSTALTNRWTAKP
jgi:putative tricarboxylic transport membrane protein